MVDENLRFLDYYMKKFSVKGRDMEIFIGCSKKTVYNYRQMKYNQLPVSLVNKFLNFFNMYFKKTKIRTFTDLYNFISRLSDDDIDFIKIKFNDFVHNDIDDGQPKDYTNKTYDDDLSESMDRMAKYYAEKEKRNNKGNTINIKTDSVSSLYLDLLEREINSIVTEEDYDFISYLRKYMSSN